MDVVEFYERYKNEPRINVTELPIGSIIYLETEHSVYQLELISPAEGKVIAKGGYFKIRLKEPCETYIVGSTMGGSMIFSKQLVQGLFCEFDKNVTTSRIKRIFVNYMN